MELSGCLLQSKWSPCYVSTLLSSVIKITSHKYYNQTMSWTIYNFQPTLYINVSWNSTAQKKFLRYIFVLHLQNVKVLVELFRKHPTVMRHKFGLLMIDWNNGTFGDKNINLIYHECHWFMTDRFYCQLRFMFRGSANIFPLFHKCETIVPLPSNHSRRQLSVKINMCLYDAIEITVLFCNTCK